MQLTGLRLPSLQVLVLLGSVFYNLLFRRPILLPHLLVDLSHLRPPLFVVAPTSFNPLFELLLSLPINVRHALIEPIEGALQLSFVQVLEVQQIGGNLPFLVDSHRHFGHFVCMRLYLRLKMLRSCSSANLLSSRVIDSMSLESKTCAVDNEACLMIILLWPSLPY